MALRIAMMKNTVHNSTNIPSSVRRLAHIAALPPPLDGIINLPTVSPPPFVLPEQSKPLEIENGNGFGFPGFGGFGGSMELMAVPKRKVTPHRKGIRNGPKALKPTPVIIRCKSCGRVKLPHFYCCSGDRGQSGERSN